MQHTTHHAYKILVNRIRTTEEATNSILNTYFGGYVNEEVLKDVPRNEGLKEESLLTIPCEDLFRDGENYLSVDDLPDRLAELGYELADFFAFCSFVEKNQCLANQYPIATHWGKGCFAIAHRTSSRGCGLSVRRIFKIWSIRFRFVCRPLHNASTMQV